MLLPGESRVFYTTPYTVQASDIVSGVSNEAIFRWRNRWDFNEATLSGSITTNKVTVPVLPSIIIPPTPPEPEGEIHTPVLEGDCCSRSLEYLSEYDEEYLLHDCVDHMQLQQKVNEFVNAASTDDEKAAAWQQAYQLWQQALDSIYDACKAAADEQGCRLVLEEQEKFYLYLSDLEKELTLLYPGAPAFVKEKVSEFLMNRVVDMCNLLHTAPADRTDSYITGDYEEIHGIFMDYVACTRKILKAEGSDVSYLVTPCAAHNKNDIEAMRLIKSGKDAAAAFDEASGLWVDGVNGIYRELYEGHGGLERDIIASECKSYNDWLAAHRPFLRLFYPEKKEVVEEMLYAELRNKCLTLCGEWNREK